MALVDIGLSKSPVDIDLVLSAFDQALESDLPEEQKVTFAHRKIEFLELYGPDVERYLNHIHNSTVLLIHHHNLNGSLVNNFWIFSVDRAQDELQSLAKVLREKNAAAPQAPKVDGVAK